MPVHDWTRVDAGVFHDFHSTWIVHLKETLNKGLLPEGFYALAEQHAGKSIADVLTLHVGDKPNGSPPGPALAVATAPPKVRRKVVASPEAAYRNLRRTLAIRHVSDHRVVALIEILSPSNKDRAKSVGDFVAKVHAALRQGVHLLAIDLFPPGSNDPVGLAAAAWSDIGELDDFPPPGHLVTLASYVAEPLPEAYLEAVAVNESLPSMPLFLESEFYVDVPLESTYLAAFASVPAVWRQVLEAAS